MYIALNTLHALRPNTVRRTHCFTIHCLVSM